MTIPISDLIYGTIWYNRYFGMDESVNIHYILLKFLGFSLESDFVKEIFIKHPYLSVLKKREIYFTISMNFLLGYLEWLSKRFTGIHIWSI